MGYDGSCGDSTEKTEDSRGVISLHSRLGDGVLIVRESRHLHSSTVSTIMSRCIGSRTRAFLQTIYFCLPAVPSHASFTSSAVLLKTSALQMTALFRSKHCCHVIANHYFRFHPAAQPSPETRYQPGHPPVGNSNSEAKRTMLRHRLRGSPFPAHHHFVLSQDPGPQPRHPSRPVNTLVNSPRASARAARCSRLLVSSFLSEH